MPCCRGIDVDRPAPMQAYAAASTAPRCARASALIWPASAAATPDSRGRHPDPARRRHAGDLALRRAARGPLAGGGPRSPGTSTCSRCRWSRGLPAQRPRRPRAADQRHAGGKSPTAWTGCCRASRAMSASPVRFGALRGERFAAAPSRWPRCCARCAPRGLLYVEPRPRRAARAAGTSGPLDVDVVVDETAGAQRHRRQARHSWRTLARQRGWALGPGRHAAADHHRAHRRLGERPAGQGLRAGAGQRAGAAATGRPIDKPAAASLTGARQ